ncbi:MAG: phosphomannomutase/phosphoglucomutase [Alcanivoracaceae bacterium]
MKKKSDKLETNKEAVSRKPKAASKPTSKPASGDGMGRYLGIAAGISLITLLVGLGALGWLQFQSQQASGAQQQADQLAVTYSALLDASMAEVETAVSYLAAHPAVATALQVPDNETTAALAAALPGARITLLPAGQLLPPDSLSFTAQDLLKQARSAEAPVSALVANPPTAFAATRIPAGGLALIEQPLENVARLLAQLNTEGHYIVVQQSSSQTLMSSGSAIVGGITGNANSNAGLRVRVTVPTPVADTAAMTLFAVVGLGMLVLVTGSIIVAFKAASTALKKDAAVLAHLAEDLASHAQSSPRGALTFSPLEAVTTSLRKLVERPAASTPAGVPARKAAMEEFRVSAADTGLLLDSAEPTATRHDLPESIFREYDIRGIVGETLTAENVELLGRAIGTEALQAGQQTVIVGRDGRLHSPELAEALIRGLTLSGRDVIDIGAAPTPVLYYATHVLNSRSGISLTGSHNPANHNGLKIVIDGVTLTGERIRGLRERLARGDLASGEGKVRQQDIRDRYVEEIARDIVLARPMKIAVDCGNGIAGPVVERLFSQLGCEIIPLFMEVDGNFPNHHPDTSNPDNYRDLIAAVKSSGADLGLAFDGDGDRLGVVTPQGEIIWPDRLMMLYSRDLLSRSPGADIIFDIKCSRELARVISQNGGRPLMWRTGHSLIKAKLRETGAPLAGEMSGHIFFADRWHGFDDGPYAAARLLEILSLESGDADQVFSQLRTGVTTPEINIPSTDKAKFAVVEKLKARAESLGGSATTIDGLRVDFDDGWGLVRASNTSAVLVARFEGRDKAALERISTLFREQLLAIDPALKLSF